MNSLSVSFIIPYYKVELPLLARAVESVVHIGKNMDWEIWIINDGSPEKEVEQYLKETNNPRIHYHFQENKGPGGARNTGIELAQKEYIHFLDADDYLFATPTLQALEMLQKEHSDILAFSFKEIHHKEFTDCRKNNGGIVFKGTGTDYILKYNLCGSIWYYFFKKDVLGTIRFTPQRYHEDEEFTLLLFLRAQQIIVTRLPAYAYYQRAGSIMHNPDRKFKEKRFRDLLYIIMRLKARKPTLNAIQVQALDKRIDMLGMAMIYKLLTDSPDSSFLLPILNRMKQTGLYPLVPHFYSVPYFIMSLSTFHPVLVTGLNKLFRFFSQRQLENLSKANK